MRIAFVSTKGGVGKTTLAANLAGLFTDLGLRALMVDTDTQPTLSSYYPVHPAAQAGLVELLGDAAAPNVAVPTELSGLDLVASNDPSGARLAPLQYAPDGRIRLNERLRAYDARYPVILIDTQGAAGVLQDSALLAADLVVSPMLPEILSAREFQRSTLAAVERLAPLAALGVNVPPLCLVLNRVDRTVDARRVIAALAENVARYHGHPVRFLNTQIPNLIAYRAAATLGVPVHQHESVRPSRRRAAAALDTMLSLADELLPEFGLPERWRSRAPAVRVAS